MPAPLPDATSRRWTADEVHALNEASASTRYECVDGELLVTPAPRLAHQEAIGALYAQLREYLRTHRIGHAFVSPADIVPAPDSLVQPDVFVTPLVDGRRPRAWTEIDHLLLAIEVVSPSSARADRVTKRRLYQRMRVPEYWVVDLEARVVERWRPDDARPEILDGTLTWMPDEAGEALTIDLATLFEA